MVSDIHCDLEIVLTQSSVASFQATNFSKPNKYIEIVANMRDNEKPENTEKS